MRLGVRANAVPFGLLVLTVIFVGAMVGVERSVLPLLASTEFGLASTAAAMSFLVAFGLAKAPANFLAGSLAGRIGRRRVLLFGWLIGLPVPWLIMWAPSWGWIGLANLLLGLNQGFTWSATILMKIDLAGPRRRGLATGVNEFAGYLSVALAALAAGYLAAAYGPRPAPFFIAAGAAVLGLALTVLAVRDTAAHVELEHAIEAPRSQPAQPSSLLGWSVHLRPILSMSRRLFGANQAGLINNFKDGVAWGLFPLYFASAGLGAREIGWLAAIYPAVWGTVQLGVGPLSDRWGRRPLIARGLLLQALALAFFAVAEGFARWAAAAALLGLGTAAVYPTLIAQVSDLVSPRERAVAIGTYRLWRDLGYVAGAVVAGTAADLFGFRPAIALSALLALISGLVANRLLPAPAAATVERRLRVGVTGAEAL